MKLHHSSRDGIEKPCSPKCPGFSDFPLGQVLWRSLVCRSRSPQSRVQHTENKRIELSRTLDLDCTEAPCSGHVWRFVCKVDTGQITHPALTEIPGRSWHL